MIKSFCRRRRFFMTSKSKVIRKERNNLLLNHVRHHGGTLRIFINEKKLVVNEVSIRRNSVVFAKHSSCVIMQSKQPTFVMMNGAVVSDWINSCALISLFEELGPEYQYGGESGGISLILY